MMKGFATRSMMCGLLLAVMSASANAQRNPTADGAIKAALALTLERGTTIDTARIATDEAALKRKFLTCKNDVSISSCVITDTTPVWLFESIMAARDTAIVGVTRYYMVYEYCLVPETSAVRALKLTSEPWVALRFAWSKGKWTHVRDEPMVVC